MKTVLDILLFFVAVTALISGVIIILYPDGSVMQMSTDLLKTSPFTTFLVPGIILTVFVGGSSLVAFVLNLRNTLRRYEWAIVAGVMTCGWVLVQMLLINTIFWLQFVYLGIGIVMMLIAYQLKGKALI